jgi:hypothetical protein
MGYGKFRERGRREIPQRMKNNEWGIGLEEDYDRGDGEWGRGTWPSLDCHAGHAMLY